MNKLESPNKKNNNSLKLNKCEFNRFTFGK